MAGARTTVRGPRRAPSEPEEKTDQPRVWVTAGKHVGQEFTLDEGEWIIGKAEDARICLGDSGVSRRHAKIIRSSDGLIVLVDLQSTNGTYVNDQRIETSPLREGAKIGIGPDVELMFSLRPRPAASPLPARPRDPAENPLTKRELEIARLVAQGLTNPQIGRKLGIKPRTVSSHLDNVYTRLRVSGRAALTRWLLESNLA